VLAAWLEGKSGGATRGSSAHTRTGAHEKTCGMRGSLVPGASSSLSLSAFRTVTIPPRVPPFRVLAGRGRPTPHRAPGGGATAGPASRSGDAVWLPCVNSPNSMWRGCPPRPARNVGKPNVFKKRTRQQESRYLCSRDISGPPGTYRDVYTRHGGPHDRRGACTIGVLHRQ
jgi:hypothetical protein